MNGAKDARNQYRQGNVRCAHLVLADRRTVPGSLLWLWATAVLAGDGERPTRKTPEPLLLFEGTNARKETEGVESNGR